MKRFTAKPDIASPRGISVIEVLISMGILAIGLLGVAAMFPVGSHYMERGDEYDRADAVAEAALNDAVASGLLDPENWLMSQGGPPTGNYTISVSSYLLNAKIAAFDFYDTNPALREQYINNEAGFVYVIDPLGVASGMVPSALTSSLGTQYQVSRQIHYFPSSVRDNSLFLSPSAPSGAGDWTPWPSYWPIRRLTVRGLPVQRFAGQIARPSVSTDSNKPQPAAPAVAPPIEFPAARNQFIATDDISVEFGDDADKPSQVLSDMIALSGNTVATSMGTLNKGSYSYFLSVVPTSVDARNDLAIADAASSYDVSVVVTKGRALAEPYSTNIPNSELRGVLQLALGERICGAKVTSSSTSGGEVALYEFSGGSGRESHEVPQVRDYDDQPWEELRAGNWVMIVGPHPQSIPMRPLLFAQWYRVVAVDDAFPSDLSLGQNETAGPTLALRGPDWPWQPSTAPSNDLRVIIVPSAVAVHTRTMQLSAGASWAPQ